MHWHLNFFCSNTTKQYYTPRVPSLGSLHLNPFYHTSGYYGKVIDVKKMCKNIDSLDGSQQIFFNSNGAKIMTILTDHNTFRWIHLRVVQCVMFFCQFVGF